VATGSAVSLAAHLHGAAVDVGLAHWLESRDVVAALLDGGATSWEDLVGVIVAHGDQRLVFVACCWLEG